ncbi:Na/Pi cotransporter family protein [Oryzibacter oryziterrae]|uniref:Na/Pi cotransporter family protein n=1 Tax=Oryzibacter oryziterrae TaxID=2766474 RepID=UPI001F403757|nr:Na/Pi cotransporter family protein [Oryzibacter oryziterrae]
MAPHELLLNLIGGVALLIWATRMVKTGILRAFEHPLRLIIRRASRSPITSCGAGLAVATALQSSAAAGLLAVSFAERGMIELAPALAFMLGADIGSTLVVQALSFDLSRVVPILLIVGVLLFLNGGEARTRQIGRIVIGLALMIMALKMVVAASLPLRDSPALAAVLNAVSGDNLIGLVIGAGLTWMVHSSVAMVLFFMTLASGGAINPEFTLALVLGANIGSGILPLEMSPGALPAAKRVLYGNLAFRIAGALVAVALMPAIWPELEGLGWRPAALVANWHTGFNLVLALVFLPFVPRAARLLERLVADPKTALSPAAPVHLDEDLLDRPQLALGAASREVIRLADMVEVILRDVIGIFEAPPRITREQLAGQENAITELQDSIKLYLARLTRNPLAEEDAHTCFDLIVFATNLGHIGDIVAKGLIAHADTKLDRHLSFSETGWAEICELHRIVLDQIRLGVTVFMTRDDAMARELVMKKDAIRDFEKTAVQSHVSRLRDGTLESIESSSIHLDVIRDLKRINAHIAAVAYPILERKGVLRTTRLRAV